MNRRGILKLIGMAPAVAPEMAKEMAAQKMGLVNSLGSRGMNAGLLGSMTVPSSGPYDDASMIKSELQHVIEALSRLDDKAARQKMRDESIAHGSRCLGPNLAALRSVSPAAAYQIQVDHDIERSIAAQKSWLTQRVDELKKKLGPLGVILS